MSRIICGRIKPGLGEDDTIKVEGNLDVTGSINLIDLLLPGMIVNVEHKVDDEITRFAPASASGWVTYSGLDYTYTPKLSDSKILIRFQIMFGGNGDSLRGKILINDSFPFTVTSGFEGNGYSRHEGATVDGNATILPISSEVMYQNSGLSDVTIGFELYRQNVATAYVNRARGYDDAIRGYSQSWVTIMEIAP